MSKGGQPLALDLALPWVESPFFESLLPEICTSEEERERASFFHHNGFLVLEDFFAESLLDQVIEETQPLFDPTVPDGRRSRVRVQDAWQESPAVRQIATDGRLESILRFLYRRRPIPFQTLNFHYGTEQRGHSDTLHFHCFPPHFMCGVWLALEDVDRDNGALFYFPGSHRLPDYTFVDLGLGSINHGLPQLFDRDGAYEIYEDFLEQLMAAHGLERVEFDARRGSVLIWAANLVHGGAPILKAGATRWSQVTHYYFDDCLYYTPMLSDPVGGDLYVRRVVDIHSSQVVPSVYQGLEVEGLATPENARLLLDEREGEPVLRGISIHKHRDLPRIMETVLASKSYRLGRALTAPYRRLKALRKP